jgi:hypothetical protein
VVSHLESIELALQIDEVVDTATDSRMRIKTTTYSDV